VATGADPALLAVSAAMAASWGFMLPSGTGPNAIAWATDHIALPRMLKAGLMLDLVGIPLIVGVVWLMGQVIG
jgi:sodium-dependent dicarboxylate transporter 2/3/5